MEISYLRNQHILADIKFAHKTRDSIIFFFRSALILSLDTIKFYTNFSISNFESMTKRMEMRGCQTYIYKTCVARRSVIL